MSNQDSTNNSQRNVTRLLAVVITMVLAVAVLAGIIAINKKNDRVKTSNTSEESTSEENLESKRATKYKEEPVEPNYGEFMPDTVSSGNAPVSGYADIEIEGYGTVTIALCHDIAPETVDNFEELVKSGFYDGLTFHRIMNGFMMQGGDPNGNGTGGSGKTIKGEFSANGVENKLSHVRGVVSMARSASYDSASSQFFIVQGDSTFLDGNYAAFGFVVNGMDIVDEICMDAEPIDDNGTIKDEDQPVITSITLK